eukprot:355986-Chlamydomonas_euryale.AAC.17
MRLQACSWGEKQTLGTLTHVLHVAALRQLLPGRSASMTDVPVYGNCVVYTLDGDTTDSGRCGTICLYVPLSASMM